MSGPLNSGVIRIVMTSAEDIYRVLLQIRAKDMVFLLNFYPAYDWIEACCQSYYSCNLRIR